MTGVSGFVTMKALKALSRLLEPANASINLLRRIDTKLDTQATSKLCAELNLIQTVRNSAKVQKDTLDITIHNLSETSEYFKSMTKIRIREYKQHWEGFLSHLKVGIKSPPLVGKPYDKTFMILTELINYLNLLYLSEIGRLICMAELGYSKAILQKEFYAIEWYFSDDIDIPDETVVPVWLALKKRKIPDDFPSEITNYACRKMSEFSSFTKVLLTGFRLGKETTENFMQAIKVHYELFEIIRGSENLSSMMKILSQQKLSLEI